MHWFHKFIFGIKLNVFWTVPPSIIRSFSLYTQQWYMSYRFADSWWASCQQTCMTYAIAVCTVKNSWWWTEELSKTHSFIRRIYHDAQSPKHQMKKLCWEYKTDICTVQGRYLYSTRQIFVQYKTDISTKVLHELQHWIAWSYIVRIPQENTHLWGINVGCQLVDLFPWHQSIKEHWCLPWSTDCTASEEVNATSVCNPWIIWWNLNGIAWSCIFTGSKTIILTIYNTGLTML